MERTQERIKAHRGMFVILGVLLVIWLTLGKHIEDCTSDRYTGSQAKRDWERQYEVDRRQDTSIDEIGRRIAK